MTKILQLTAGTGSFYCGTCIRDTSFLRHLKQEGVEGLLAPLYLPIVSDEGEVYENHNVLLNGIELYFKSKFPLLSYLPDMFFLIFKNEAVMRFAAKFSSMTASASVGNLLVKLLKNKGVEKKETLKALSSIKKNFQPDIVLISNALLSGMVDNINAIFNCKVVCTLQGEEPFVDSLPLKYKEQAWQLIDRNLQKMDLCISVSEYYQRRLLDRMGFNHPIEVVHNGIAINDFKKADQHKPFVLGYLARMHRDKGLERLVDAYIKLNKDRNNPFSLIVVGACIRHDNLLVNELKVRLEKNQLSAYVSWHPNVSRTEKIELLSQMSTMCVPAEYGESFGLYVIEAMASGVPVVLPHDGGFPEILSLGKNGLLYEKGSFLDLCNKINELVENLEQRISLAEFGLANVKKHFSTEIMVKKCLAIFKQKGYIA